MKLSTINEATSDERQKLVKELNKLAKDAELAATEELHTLLDDPSGMVRHTLRGIQAKFSLLEDETWWQQMFEYWKHLPQEFLMKTYEDVFKDAMERIEKAVTAGVHVEGIIQGFLGILGRIGALFLALAFGPAMATFQREMRRGNKKSRKDKKDRQDPSAPSRDDLPPTPAALAKETFEIRRLNPYIAYKFVEACVNETKKMIAAGEISEFDEPSEVGDLGEETPFNSGEDVEYPDSPSPSDDEPPF
jgi:hypothetical protein